MNGRLKKSPEVTPNVMTDSPEIINDVQFKFLVIGDFGVGKTAIVNRFVNGRFSSKYKITIGADFALKLVNWDENTRIHLQLWDIAGNERFGYMTRVYYKYAIAAVIVFDLTRSTTMQSVSKWLHDLREKVTLSDGSAVPVVLLANKSDVLGTVVPTDSINKLCKENHIDTWFVTSAKDNIGIGEAFHFLMKRSLQLINSEPVKEGIVLNDEVIFDKSVYQKNRWCCK